MYSSRSAGLEVETISGVSKGAGYEPGMFTKNPYNNDDCAHAWNKVKIDGTWFLMDATWSAGAVGEFKKTFLFIPLFSICQCTSVFQLYAHFV